MHIESILIFSYEEKSSPIICSKWVEMEEVNKPATEKQAVHVLLQAETEKSGQPERRTQVLGTGRGMYN